MKSIIAILSAAALCLSACQQHPRNIDWSSMDYGACQLECDEDGHYRPVDEARK